MDGYDGDAISEAEWDEAENECLDQDSDDSCYEGPSDLFDA